MLFNASERKGVLIILFMIIGIIVVPRHFLPKNHHLFLLPLSVETPMDSMIPFQNLNQTIIPASRNKRNTISKPLELNTADSVTLFKIRGIGPYYASKIIRYRQRLGGFYSVKQLKELKMTYFNVDSCEQVFTVNPDFIIKCDMDTMTFKAILHHPYLEYEDVQMIFNAKRQYGHLSFSILEKNKILAAHKLKKIKPYFR